MSQTSSTSDFSNPALLLIDLQVGFFKDPALARSRQQVAANCNRLVVAANAAGIPVISVRTVHKEDRSTWTLKMLEDGQGYLFEGTSSAAYLPELLLDGAIEVIKRRDSAFWNTGLGDLLLVRRANSLVIAGVSSDTCISATAADAFAANLPVAVAVDATASGDPDFESSTLEFMRKQYRQKLQDTNHIISQWESEKE